MIRKGGRTPRRITSINAKLRRGEGWIDATIGNVSSHGVMLRLDDPPPVGARVELRHRGWTMTGRVVWRSRSRAGIAADAPIDQPALFADSGIGQVRSEALHAQPARGLWHWLRRR